MEYTVPPGDDYSLTLGYCRVPALAAWPAALHTQAGTCHVTHAQWLDGDRCVTADNQPGRNLRASSAAPSGVGTRVRNPEGAAEEAVYFPGRPAPDPAEDATMTLEAMQDLLECYTRVVALLAPYARVTRPEQYYEAARRHDLVAPFLATTRAAFDRRRLAVYLYASATVRPEPILWGGRNPTAAAAPMLEHAEWLDAEYALALWSDPQVMPPSEGILDVLAVGGSLLDAREDVNMRQLYATRHVQALTRLIGRLASRSVDERTACFPQWTLCPRPTSFWPAAPLAGARPPALAQHARGRASRQGVWVEPDKALYQTLDLEDIGRVAPPCMQYLMQQAQRGAKVPTEGRHLIGSWAATLVKAAVPAAQVVLHLSGNALRHDRRDGVESDVTRMRNNLAGGKTQRPGCGHARKLPGVCPYTNNNACAAAAGLRSVSNPVDFSMQTYKQDHV